MVPDKVQDAGCTLLSAMPTPSAANAGTSAQSPVTKGRPCLPRVSPLRCTSCPLSVMGLCVVVVRAGVRGLCTLCDPIFALVESVF